MMLATGGNHTAYCLPHLTPFPCLATRMCVCVKREPERGEALRQDDNANLVEEQEEVEDGADGFVGGS
jgi:hypothetical protein